MSVCLFMILGAFCPSTAQAQIPNCFNFVDVNPSITCNPDGSYTYTFQIINNSTFVITEASFSEITPASAVITPNPYPLSPSLGIGQSRQITVTISGVGPGTGGICFNLNALNRLRQNCCSLVDVCITLPSCPNPICAAAGTCCSKAPIYNGAPFANKKTAAVTGWSDLLNFPNDAALTVFDLSGANAFSVGGVNNVPLKYTGPTSQKWSMTNLGSIFGVTIDHLGNIYVTASSAYSQDYYPQGSGRIFKIANGTGLISNFAQLPQSSAQPALGNISYDCTHKQFFVTNMEDGKIYRLNALGSIVGTYDHDAPDDGTDGFAPLGQRLWAVQVHNNRVYYSVWKEYCDFANPTANNEVWSVKLDSAGNFTADVRQEVTVPSWTGGNTSNPVSDISFAQNGRMLLSERSMQTDTRPTAHASRVLEYACAVEGWILAPPFPTQPYRYNIGSFSPSQCGTGFIFGAAGAAGGIDYDYNPLANFSMWATGDFLTAGTPAIYGLQGFPPTGGTVTNSALIDLDGNTNFEDKTQIGDVAVTCRRKTDSDPIDNPPTIVEKKKLE